MIWWRNSCNKFMYFGNSQIIIYKKFDFIFDNSQIVKYNKTILKEQKDKLRDKFIKRCYYERYS